jgi:hypothetical protein
LKIWFLAFEFCTFDIDRLVMNTAHMFAQFLERLRRNQRTSAESAPVIDLPHPSEAHYVPLVINLEEVPHFIEYVHTVYKKKPVRVSRLAEGGQKYRYIRANGEAEGVASVPMGKTLLRIDDMCDAEGQMLPEFASGDDQFLNNAMRFVGDKVHAKTKKR